MDSGNVLFPKVKTTLIPRTNETLLNIWVNAVKCLLVDIVRVVYGRHWAKTNDKTLL